jgi:hypothetical protein
MMETNPQSFPFGQRGTILTGENAGWSVVIVDDAVETGGYVVYLEDPNPDPDSPDFTVYDWWLEHAAHIPVFIEDMDWQIRWPAAAEG